MDRPTTRRRRHAADAQSVSVADLLARTTPAEMASVSAIKARAAAEASARAAEEALVRTGVPLMQFPIAADQAAGGEEPRTANRLARTIMVATAAMLVCGVVTAVAVLTGERPHRMSPSVPTVGPAEITGPTVFRPDLLNQQLAAGLLTVGHRPVTAAGTVTQPGSPDGPAEPGAPSAQVVAFVTNFYQALKESPERAFGMLGPQMQGDGPAGFVESWGDLLVQMQDLEVSGGFARVVVTVSWPRDATVLRTEQLLFVSEDPEPKIVWARLLSAHRG